MIELDEIRRLLADMNLSRVAEACDVPYGRIYRLANRPEHAPSFDTVSRVTAYLESRKLTKAA